jgi:hypothetical protein
MAQKAPIALRALPQQSWGRWEEIAPQPIDVAWMEMTFSVVIREENRLGLPQLVGEVPEGRWGPFLRYAIALTLLGRPQAWVEATSQSLTLSPPPWSNRVTSGFESISPAAVQGRRPGSPQAQWHCK